MDYETLMKKNAAARERKKIEAALLKNPNEEKEEKKVEIKPKKRKNMVVKEVEQDNTELEKPVELFTEDVIEILEKDNK